MRITPEQAADALRFMGLEDCEDNIKWMIDTYAAVADEHWMRKELKR